MSDDKKNWSAEDVYDAEIAPLMSRIIAICKEHKIPMLATYQYVDSDEYGPGFCTTKLLFAERAPSDMNGLAMSWPKAPVMLTETHVTNPDGSKVITIGRVR